MEMQGVLWVLAVILVLAGLVGTVLPILPGAPLVFLGLLLAAWAEGFQKVGWFPLTLLGLLTVASVVLDVVSSGWGAKKLGASKLAVVGALVGTVVGFFFGFPGLFLGPFIGAVVGEYLTLRDLRRAGKIGLGTSVGVIVGMAVSLALAFTMVGIFVLAYVI